MKRILLLTIALGLLSGMKTDDKDMSKNSVNKSGSYTAKPYPQGFAAYKGVNIAHWLSQVFGWSPRETFFTEEDVKLIKSLGFDHIRLPIDEEQLWTENGAPIDSAFGYLAKAIDWSMKHDLCVIVDLHILRSHHFNAKNGEGEMLLWSDTAAQATFLKLWGDIQQRTSKYPTSKVAYELLNEPAAPKAEQWNSLIARAVTEIRKKEPNRILFVGANNWQTISNLQYLEVPGNDSNIVIAFHTYDPMFVTHYKAPWTKFKDYKGPVQYPGLSADPKIVWQQLDSADPSMKAEVDGINNVYNRQVFDSMVCVAVKRAEELNLSVYCGEFGCLNNVDTATRHAYYRDFVGALNACKVGKAVWDYKGSFQIVGYDISKRQNTGVLDSPVIKILTR